MNIEDNLFVAILANVDDSILNLKLNNNFEIKRTSKENTVNIVQKITKLPNYFINNELTSLNCINDDNTAYYLTKTDYNPNEDQEILNEQWYFIQDLCDKIRLFKEGNIRIPFCYQIRNRPLSGIIHKLDKNAYPELLHIEKEEITPILSFIENMHLPFKKEFLQLAFNNYNLSYEVENLNLQFLSLMNAMEVLFHPSGEGELTYRISRNVAVLLGRNKEESKQIQDKIKHLYNIRSRIVHSGRLNVDFSNLRKLRCFTRESLKEINNIGKNKEELHNLLNSSGFGERPWLYEPNMM